MFNSNKNVWFPFSQQNETPDVPTTHKLFCFHHAGGNAAVFKPWIAHKDNINIYPIELPGKATRMREGFKDHYEKLVPEIASAIEAEAEGSAFSLFGHSMGAMLAFKTAYFLETKLNCKPSNLIVAGRHAPQDDYKDPYQTYMGDEKLIEELQRVNGTPKEILENEELLKLLLPTVKNDYKLNESFDYDNEKLSIPITAHVGLDDPDASVSQMERWQFVTNQSFEIKAFEGDHFFVYGMGESYYEEMRKILQNC